MGGAAGLAAQLHGQDALRRRLARAQQRLDLRGPRPGSAAARREATGPTLARGGERLRLTPWPLRRRRAEARSPPRGARTRVKAEGRVGDQVGGALVRVDEVRARDQVPARPQVLHQPPRRRRPHRPPHALAHHHALVRDVGEHVVLQDACPPRQLRDGDLPWRGAPACVWRGQCRRSEPGSHRSVEGGEAYADQTAAAPKVQHLWRDGASKGRARVRGKRMVDKDLLSPQIHRRTLEKFGKDPRSIPNDSIVSHAGILLDSKL